MAVRLQRVAVRDGGEHALARIAARQAKHALNEANGANAARGELSRRLKDVGQGLGQNGLEWQL
jgi:hypothetical protein